MAKNKKYTYEYPRPAVAVDLVIFRGTLPHAEVLVIERKNDPFKGHYALPGGFVDENETIEVAAARELQEETSLFVFADIKNAELNLVGIYSDPQRDPRGRVISIAYSGVLKDMCWNNAEARDDAVSLKWVPVSSIPKYFKLAFDHNNIVLQAQTKVYLK